MTDKPMTEPLAEIKAALQDPNHSIRIVQTSLGPAARVMVKTRKIGPLLFPSGDQDVSDVLALLGRLYLGSDLDQRWVR